MTHRLQNRPLKERVWDRIDKNGPIPKYAPGLGKCWIWQGHTVRGHGRIGIKKERYIVHRVVYELLVGKIPEGLEIDHLCRVRACCNPKHLEPVTRRENQIRGFSPVGLNARKTHCSHGHPFERENLYVHTDGSRVCRTCGRLAQAGYRKRRHAARLNS